MPDLNWASSETVRVLAFLLPGFVAAAVFYSLTSHPRPSQFERVIQALVFTAIVQGATLLVADNPNLGLSLLMAAGVGLVFALLSNHDWAHWVLRKIHVTKRDLTSLRMVFDLLTKPSRSRTRLDRSAAALRLAC